MFVMHSYGEIPGTESVRGLLRDDRKKFGKRRGVVRLIYVTAIVPQVGKSLNKTIEPLMLKYKSINCVKVEVCHLQSVYISSRSQSTNTNVKREVRRKGE